MICACCRRWHASEGLICSDCTSMPVGLLAIIFATLLIVAGLVKGAL